MGCQQFELIDSFLICASQDRKHQVKLKQFNVMLIPTHLTRELLECELVNVRLLGIALETGFITM